MNTGIIIQARMGSTRLPGKILGGSGDRSLRHQYPTYRNGTQSKTIFRHWSLSCHYIPPSPQINSNPTLSIKNLQVIIESDPCPLTLYSANSAGRLRKNGY